MIETFGTFVSVPPHPLLAPRRKGHFLEACFIFHFITMSTLFDFLPQKPFLAVPRGLCAQCGCRRGAAAALVGTAGPGEPTERGGTAGCHVPSPTTCPRPNTALGSLHAALPCGEALHPAACRAAGSTQTHSADLGGSWRQHAAVPAEP